MTYSDNLEKLRQAGVVDMIIEPDCILNDGKYDIHILLQHNFEEGTMFDVWYTEDNSIGRTELDFKYTILGKPLTIGRVLRWIEKTTWCIDNAELDVYARVENTGKIMEIRHNKDLPLEEQPNKEEIAQFLVGLVK